MPVGSRQRVVASAEVVELTDIGRIAMPEFEEGVAVGPGLVEAVVRRGLVEEVG